MAKARTSTRRAGPVIDLYPHEGNHLVPGGQKRLIELCLTHQTVTAVVGRAWGKTVGCILMGVEEGGTCSSHYELAYGSPTYKVSKPVYLSVKRALKPLVVSHSDTDLVLELTQYNQNDRATWRFWSLDKADNLRYFRLHRFIGDECSDIKAYTIANVIEPMLLGRPIGESDTGKALYITTPKWKGVGARWVHAEWRAGNDPDIIDHASMHGPTYGNPTLTAAAIDKRKAKILRIRGMNAVREEIYAEWLEGEGAVFTNLLEVFVLDYEERVEGELYVGAEPDTGDEDAKRAPDHYIMSIDFGKKDDWTVGRVFNRRTRHEEALIRLRGPYHEQGPKLHDLRTRYNKATVYCDEGGGHGGAISEWMARQYGDGYVGKAWNARTKEFDITTAQGMCERAGHEEEVVGPSWRMLKIPWVMDEWQSYQIEVRTKDDKERSTPWYGAPPGMHDDSVTSACLIADPLSQVYVPERGEEKPAKWGTTGWYEAESGQSWGFEEDEED